MASTVRTRARALIRRGGGDGPRSAGTIHGTARLGRRTKDLVKRLGPRDVAVIDHPDLDRIAAEELLASGVPAVVNCAPSVTGRYPNAGPLLLVEAGVALVDAPGSDLFDRLSDGDPIEVAGGTIRSVGRPLAEGEALEPGPLAEAMERQRERIGEAIAEFAENTVTHMRREGELLAGAIQFPPTRTRFRDRHVLIVVRGPNHHRDLQALRAYIRDVGPILVGVDGGADAILEAGLRPDVVLGDMDSATDAALGCGAELIVHAYPDGAAPGAERLRALGLDHTLVPAAGTSQDVAMLLAHEKGAGLLVSVGAHFNLVEFLDKDRPGMSSTFLTRLRVGETLVDAKGVSRLYRAGASVGQMALVGGAVTVLLAVVVASSPALDNLLELLWLKVRVALGL